MEKRWTSGGEHGGGDRRGERRRGKGERQRGGEGRRSGELGLGGIPKGEERGATLYKTEGGFYKSAAATRILERREYLPRSY